MRRAWKVIFSWTITVIVLAVLLTPQQAGTFFQRVSRQIFAGHYQRRAVTGRYIASIVYLTNHGLPKNTIETLKAMKASEVYLYVAYYSDAYFRIPKNPYGMAEPADVLRQALSQLHQAGFSVTAVISSALLDPKQATAAGLGILQPHSSIFNPITAKPFLTQLVKNLVQYPIDGVYIGEPYSVNASASTPSSMASAWLGLYQSLLKITQPAKLPMQMVLPDNFAVGSRLRNQSGLSNQFTQLPFAAIGIDQENAYSGAPAQDLSLFKQVVRKTVQMAHGRPSITEISLRQADLKTPISPTFFKQEVQIVANSHVNALLLFANEFWPTSPYQKQYAKALQSFLNTPLGK